MLHTKVMAGWGKRGEFPVLEDGIYFPHHSTRLAPRLEQSYSKETKGSSMAINSNCTRRETKQSKGIKCLLVTLYRSGAKALLI